jgi:hypothetical protein
VGVCVCVWGWGGGGGGGGVSWTARIFVALWHGTAKAVCRELFHVRISDYIIMMSLLLN